MRDKVREYAETLSRSDLSITDDVDAIEDAFVRCLKKMLDDSDIRHIYTELAWSTKSLNSQQGHAVFSAVNIFAMMWRELKATYGLDDLVKQIEAL